MLNSSNSSDFPKIPASFMYLQNSYRVKKMAVMKEDIVFT